MFPLRCTVRNCYLPLHRDDRSLRCEHGHHFDQAKEGYWNLAQPQDRKSVKAGDCDEAVLARQRWIARGHMSTLTETLRDWLAPLSDTPFVIPRTLDLGCGEGSFGRSLFGGQADGYCGIDLSKRAVRLAARHWPDATWVLANADRILPAADESVDRVLSLFGRRPVSEISRVLVKGGTCIVAVPAAEDLVELREHIQGNAAHRDRTQAIIDQMTQSSLVIVARQQWKHRAQIGADAMKDALAMTYRAFRNTQQQRVESLPSSMPVTLSAELLSFRKESV